MDLVKINLGQTGGDKKGDPAREAFRKHNQNMEVIQGALTGVPSAGDLAAVVAQIPSIATVPSAVEGVIDDEAVSPEGVKAAIAAESSPFRFGAVGDGTADDSVAWAAAEIAFSVLRLPEGSIFNIDTTIPTKLVFGTGKVKRLGVELGGFAPVFDIYRSNLFWTPDDPVKLLGFPATPGQLNTIFSTGSKAQQAAYLVRSTIFGSANVENEGAELDRVDVFGNGALRRAMFAERVATFASLGLEQLSCPEFTGHNFWFDGGGSGIAIAPGSPGWDYAGLETANPGIGAKILAAAIPASTRGDSAYLGAFCRDAMNFTIKGVDSYALGYRALAYQFLAYRNNAFGTDVFRNGVFLQEATGMGHRNGLSWQEGKRLSLFGTFNFFNAVRGDDVIGLGYQNGLGVTDATRAILIGKNLLNGLGVTNLTDVFAMGMGTVPLLCGSFATGRLAINRQYSATAGIRGTLHVFSGASMSADNAALSATDIVIEGAGDTGITVLGGNTSARTIFFGRAGAEAANYIQFGSHTTTTSQYFRVAVGDAERLRIDGTGNLMVGRTSASAAANSAGWVFSLSGFGYSVRNNTSAQAHLQFFNAANTAVALVGSIYTSGSTLSLRDGAANDRVAINTTGVGFYGTAPVAKQTLPAAGVVTADDIRTALINYGLAA